MEPNYDVVVVGGGAAGLSAAVTLGRARRSVLVIDAGQPRNRPAAGVHNLLGQEGIAPGELLRRGRAEVESYGGTVVDGEVVEAVAADGRFTVRLADGRATTARRLLLTTGLVDELPDVPGLTERWGRDVLHCPYCHGHEVRDRTVAVIATGPLAAHQALLWTQWTADVVLVRHAGEPLAAEPAAQLAARGVRFSDGPVAGLAIEDDALRGLRLADGRVVPCDAVVVGSRLVARGDLLSGLGLQVTEQRMGEHPVGTYVAAEPTGATAVPGVYVAGNLRDVSAQVVVAAAQGLTTAAAINMDLLLADTRALAVTA